MKDLWKNNRNSKQKQAENACFVFRENFMTTQKFEYKGMYCKKWLSDNEKAKIQIIHGLGEMSEYYEQFAEYITAKGVSVYLCEYREHGRTALPANIDNIVQTAAKECGDFSSYVQSESDTPLFLLGHSLGSQMAQYILRHGGNRLYGGVILTGCPHIHGTDTLLSDIDAEISEKGADAPSTDVFLKLFGKVAEPFPEKCTVSWVTSDLERAEYYETLPYTNKMYSCRFYRSFLQLANEVQDDKYLSDIFPKPPVLLISGTEDMMGDKGEYAKEKASVLKANGFDVRLVILDGMRHSVLQEKERTDVYRLIADFISKQEHNDNL